MYRICITFVLHLYCICIGFVLHLYCICIGFALHLYWHIWQGEELDCCFGQQLVLWSPALPSLIVYLHFCISVFLFLYLCILALFWATAGGDVWSPSLSSMFVCTSHLDPPANGEVVFLAGLLLRAFISEPQSKLATASFFSAPTERTYLMSMSCLRFGARDRVGWHGPKIDSGCTKSTLQNIFSKIKKLTKILPILWLRALAGSLFQREYKNDCGEIYDWQWLRPPVLIWKVHSAAWPLVSRDQLYIYNWGFVILGTSYSVFNLYLHWYLYFHCCF